MSRNWTVTKDSTPFVRVKWKSRVVGLHRGNSVDVIIRRARTYFCIPPAESNDLLLVGELRGDPLELTDDVLELLPDGAIVIIERRSMLSYLGTAAVVAPRENETMQVFIKYLTGKTLIMSVRPDDTVSLLKENIEHRDGMPANKQSLIFAGATLEDGRDLRSYNIQKESTLHMICTLRGGKPVIYLFPPRPLLEVAVSVRLVPQWTFSHIYPLVDIKSPNNGKQEVAWTVSARPDGTLVEHGTNLELCYLFWEALSDSTIPHSPPLTPVDINSHELVSTRPVELEDFDPAFPSLEPDSPTAVMLPFADLLPYLDGVLKSLTLHTSARNDFITYWLPALSKQPFVALRFLPQPTYERAAELEVSPVPDVVTRVFMLFRGVKAEEAVLWAEARERVGQVHWPSVVGVGSNALDRGLFRVLEWGAMEVF